MSENSSSGDAAVDAALRRWIQVGQWHAPRKPELLLKRDLLWHVQGLPLL